jgi:hypothetical protein
VAFDLTSARPLDQPESPIARNSAYAKPAPAGGYLTQLPADEEVKFRAWVKQNNVPFDPSPEADYDMRGFYMALKGGDPRATTGVNPNDGKMHFGDYWKTPYHKSFSAESQWATAGAPKWNEKDQLVSPDGHVVFDERAQPASVAKFDIASAKPANAGPSMAKQIAMAPVGATEMLLSGATGALAMPIAGLGGLAAGATNYVNRLAGRDTPDIDEAGVVRDIRNQLTYQPRSDSAKAAGALMGRGLGWVDRNVAEPALGAIGNVSPTAENVVRTAVPAGAEIASAAFPVARGLGGALRTAEGMAPTVVANAADIGPAMSKPLYRPSAPAAAIQPAAATAEDILARQVANSPQSMGAAAASPNLTGVSQELKDAVVKAAKKNGGAINPEVLARHVEASTLPVPMQLTEGMATQSPRLISMEQNMRGRYPQLTERHNDLNRQLGQNVQAIRDEVGPDVFSTNHVEHGDTLIAAYRAKAAAADSQIDGLYQKLRDAAGQNFPVDGKAILENATKELHKRLLFDHAPPEIMRTLDRLATNGMTFENFESLRTNLARTMRSPSVDGNVKAAAGVIREEMENLPLGPAAAQLKPYADAARSAARAQFRALDADPAYKAAVEGSVPPDRFVSRFVINAPRDDVVMMRDNLADNPTATQTMGVSALDHLRDAARLSPHYEGNFASASYNKALLGLSPKIQALLPAQAAENLEKLGNVARYTTAQPKGSFVNNSNTFVAGAADYGAGALEGMVNVAAQGVPIGTWGRKAIENARSGGKVRQSLTPGAGLGNLQPKP